MAYLASADVAEFTELTQALATSQGDLSVHLRKLEDAGYAEIEKSFQARTPLTRARLTSAGREAFSAYLAAMSQLVKDAKKP
jgi:DNA-binding MarR family transcriptional regulator